MNETPYALVKLEEAARTIKQITNELPSLRKRLEKHKANKSKAREAYGDLKQQHGRLLGAFNSAALPLMEMELDDIAGYSAKLSQSVQSFNLMTPDYTKLCAALNSYLLKLPVSNISESVLGSSETELKTTNAAIIGRLMANVKLGYYPTDTEHIKHLARGIEFPEGITTNLLDPCCGCGIALRTLAQGNNEEPDEQGRRALKSSNGSIDDSSVVSVNEVARKFRCYTYGVELDRHRAEEAQTRLHRVGFGSYFHSRISNEAFHVMLLNPPYLWTLTEGGNNTRSEKRFLVDSLYHLMHGGLLIYIIPYYRLTDDICRVLCDNFEDLTVWKFMGAEFKKFKQVAVMGIRRKRRDGSDMVHELASLIMDPDNLPELAELPDNRYPLPATTKKVELFKGAEFNVAELAEQLKRSTSFSKLFEKNKLDSDIKRPLLPLNIGQVGLIGGSGLINGLVECGSPHIIKGRIVKENHTHKEENINSRGELLSTTVYETRSNKMVFNILTPQGFIALTDYTSGDTGTATDTSKENSGGSIVKDAPAVFISKDSRFTLGQVVVTANARNILSDWDINAAVTRHQSGDWGTVGKADQRANDNAVKNGDRILSAYMSAVGDKFWIITEHDRSCTTVMMPEDY